MRRIWISVFAAAAFAAFGQTNNESRLTPADVGCCLTNESTSEVTEPDSGGGAGRPRVVREAPEPKTIIVPVNAPDPLQVFIDEANPGDEIVVAPGVYDMGGRQLNKEGPATRLVIDKPLTLRSEKGPEKTIIAGGPSTRCIYMTNGVKVIGFTITGGETMKEGTEGNKFTALSGGGVWSEPEGVLENCTVVSNTALWYGGGLYGGKAVNCMFTENTARRSGGGASQAELLSCVVQLNRAGQYGGGAHHCKVISCTVAHNRSEIMGGGLAYGSALNTAVQYNQTLLGNHNFFSVKMSYCCSDPKPNGAGNIGGDPGFRNGDQGVYTLEFNSPMIDSGTNVFYTTTDFAGVPRILDGNNNRHARIDIGAFEYVHPLADTDLDGVSDRDEIKAGTGGGWFEHPAEEPVGNASTP